MIEDRNPETTLTAMITMWYRPLGLPHSILVDPDGAYLGRCQEWHTSHGIQYQVIPSEEAWKLGKIGRRSALARTLAERLIDQHGIATAEALDKVLLALCFSLNSSTYTHTGTARTKRSSAAFPGPPKHPRLKKFNRTIDFLTKSIFD